jgi:hypothetical protein
LLEPPQGAAPTIGLLQRADICYLAARNSVFPPDAQVADCLALREALWLAAAGRGALAEPAFDRWQQWRQQRGAAAHLPPPSLHGRSARPDDFVVAAARRFLRQHYAEWAGQTAPDWGDGLVARARWNNLATTVDET